MNTVTKIGFLDLIESWKFPFLHFPMGFNEVTAIMYVSTLGESGDILAEIDLAQLYIYRIKDEYERLGWFRRGLLTFFRGLGSGYKIEDIASQWKFKDIQGLAFHYLLMGVQWYDSYYLDRATEVLEQISKYPEKYGFSLDISSSES